MKVSLYIPTQTNKNQSRLSDQWCTLLLNFKIKMLTQGKKIVSISIKFNYNKMPSNFTHYQKVKLVVVKFLNFVGFKLK